MAALNLSDLKNGHPYPLENNPPTAKCLIHMKLTDLCTRSIDALVNSNRGAVFSLRFSETGGMMVIPVDNGEPRKFQFKTAANQTRSEGQNILECVRQASSGSHMHMLSCTGPIEHRLTVQGNDQIFKSTKERMKEVELKRKEGMAQEITLPATKGRKKVKPTLKPPSSVSERTTSPTFRHKQPIKPPPPKTNPSPKMAPGGARASSHTKITAPVKISHSVRERVIHFLALKPQRREEVLSKIRKETKKSESSISGMVDAILSEVSEVSSGNHKLKSEFHGDVQVEWPHYNEAEKALIRRKYGKPAPMPPPTNSQPLVPPPQTVVKRELPEPEPEVTPKRPKLEPPQFPTHKPHPLTITKDASKVVDPPAPQVPNKPSEERHLKKKKKEKKPKKKRDKAHPDSAVTSDPSSTTGDVPDYKSEFPPIQNDQERTVYKQTFNNDYTEYIRLKDNIDLVSGQYQKESAALNEKLQSLPKRCEEASAIRKLIRAKYSELHQKEFVENKRRFQELHNKLDHIKQQVMEYDRTRGGTL